MLHLELSLQILAAYKMVDTPYHEFSLNYYTYKAESNLTNFAAPFFFYQGSYFDKQDAPQDQ